MNQENATIISVTDLEGIFLCCYAWHVLVINNMPDSILLVIFESITQDNSPINKNLKLTGK